MNSILGGNGSSAPGTAGAELIKDVDTAGFMADVIEASRTVPVIVDFWAPWCGPCKQLGPTLEKLVNEAGGKVKLAKVNIDENQQLAQQLHIQSIPMVYAFVGGRPVDGFQGAIPESEAKAFIDRIVEAAGAAGAEAGGQAATPVAQLIAEGKAALAKGDEGTAMGYFTRVLESDEKNVEAIAGLARCYLNAGESEAARNLIADVPEEHADHPDIASVRSTLELTAESGATAAVGELAARVEADPTDHQARYDLAMARFAAGEKQAAVDTLLEIIGRNAGWNDGAARKQLLKLFEALGPDDPVTQDGRQRLSTILFS